MAHHEESGGEGWGYVPPNEFDGAVYSMERVTKLEKSMTKETFHSTQFYFAAPLSEAGK